MPKEGKPGATRPLGISNLEDKIVQMQMQKVLESIYEPIFLECSYGFRPGRGCHDAIKDLHQHLFRNEIQTIIDIDLKNFFGTIDHQMLEDLLKQKIKDTRFMRYILRGANNSLHFLSCIFWVTPPDEVLDDIRLFLSHFQVTI
ncbi:MAG TPA: reverse transcriptase/maturase family protein [Bacteroidia bacterium]